MCSPSEPHVARYRSCSISLHSPANLQLCLFSGLEIKDLYEVAICWAAGDIV